MTSAPAPDSASATAGVSHIDTATVTVHEPVWALSGENHVRVDLEIDIVSGGVAIILGGATMVTGDPAGERVWAETTIADAPFPVVSHKLD